LPPLTLGAALLVWGWQCELLAFAVPMALVLEAARLSPWRWRFQDRDLHRIADLSGIALLLVVAYQFDAQAMRGIYGVLQWLPFVLFLLTAAQVYSTREAIPYTAVFLSVRRAAARGRITEPRALDMRGPCLIASLVAATAGPVRSPVGFALTCVIAAWALWPQRSRRFRAVTWLVCVSLGVGIGYAGQAGVVALRRVMEPMMMSWFHEYLLARKDPYRAYTSMGQIGRLKLSDRIVLRVRTDRRPGLPPLLRTATYTTFARNMWVAHARDFDTVSSDIEGSTWALAQEPPASARTLTISTYLRFGRGLLAAPLGTFALEALPVEQVFRNALGTLKVLQAPGHVEYRARYADGVSPDAPPGRADTSVPPAEEALMARLVAQLGVAGADAGTVMAAIRRFFEQGFGYSVTLERPTQLSEPLHEFLLETRTGHCEFFASATVLMLRAAGIPARYASGYSVQEWSELDAAYVVRRRHAHAWALVWVDGAWRDFDTTPAAWAAIEQAEAPWWEGAYDLSSWLRYHFARWRWAPAEEAWSTWALWLVVPLGLILTWRLYRGDRVRTRKGRRTAAAAAVPGLDSALYALERELVGRGHVRRGAESLGEWLRRLERDGEMDGAGELAREVLPVHYRYRFHPAGPSEEDRRRLRESVARWRQRHGPGDARR
jgi:transglutaminase-like putative cysteine protease